MNTSSCKDFCCRLSELKKGQKSTIVQVSEEYLQFPSSLEPGELERRLLEIGFLEGMEVFLSHEGPVGKDPIVVLLQSCHFVALRRQEADAILVRVIS